MKGFEVGLKTLDQAGLGHFVAEINSTRKPEGVGSAMALYGNTIQPQEGAAVDAARAKFEPS